MAQKKKSSKNRQGNLPPLPLKQPNVSRWPTMEDVTDSEEDNDFIPMDPIDSSDLPGDDSEIEMESEDEDDRFRVMPSLWHLLRGCKKHMTRRFMETLEAAGKA
jgi:hypothetical protein